MEFNVEFNEAFDTVSEKVSGWIEGMIEMLPNLVAAVLVVLLFWVIALLVRKGLRRGLGHISQYRQVHNLITSVAFVAVLLIGLFVALGVLDLDKTVTSLLAGAGIIGLALAFAFQDIAENFISGVLLAIRRPFREGDVIESNEFMGVVEEITLRTTLLRTFQGQIVMIPNGQVFQNPLTNYSRTGKRRIDLTVGVAYGDDLEKARRVALEAVGALDSLDPNRNIELFYTEFGDSSINFDVRFWIDFAKQTDFLRARSDAIMRIKQAFDKNDITIPFPIRTLDFGVVGGEKLSEVLPQHLYERGPGGNRQAAGA